MRFTPTRGSMRVGQSQGGLPPDSLVEREEVILREPQRLIDAHHDASHGAMLQIALAPCSPFSVSRDLVRGDRLATVELGPLVERHNRLAQQLAQSRP